MAKRLTKDHIDAHVSPKIRINLRIYLGIGLLIGMAVIYQIIRSHDSGLPVITGLIAGLVIGVGASRIHKLSWDEDNGQITRAIDWIGGVVLVLYILIEINRERVVGLVVPASAVLPVSLAVLAGIMWGRVVGNLRAVKRILRDRELL